MSSGVGAQYEGGEFLRAMESSVSMRFVTREAARLGNEDVEYRSVLERFTIWIQQIIRTNGIMKTCLDCITGPISAIVRQNTMAMPGGCNG